MKTIPNFALFAAVMGLTALPTFAAAWVGCAASAAPLPTPTQSLGFDNGKEASKVLGGEAPSGMQDWDDHLSPAYAPLRGEANYALIINHASDASKVAPYNGVPDGMSDSQSWTLHASMRLAEVNDGVLFSLSGAVWDDKPYLGVEYVGSGRVRVVYGSRKGSARKMQLIAPVVVANATLAYHSYALTFNADATPHYTLYIDGAKAGDSGAADPHGGYAVDWAIGNYYGGAQEVGSTVFHQARVDDFAIWKDTCLSADQVRDLANQFPVWVGHYQAPLVDDADFLDLPWSPELPSGTTSFDGSEFVLTNASARAVTTVTFDRAVTLGTLTIQSAEDREVQLAGYTNLTVHALDVSQANGGVSFRVPRNWAASDNLKEYLRGNECRVEFQAGDGAGVNLDYGTANASALWGHGIFKGGTHAFTYGMGDLAEYPFSATGSRAMPSVLVGEGTTLNYTLKDMNGWIGDLKETAVVRVEKGGVLNFLQKEDKTMFMNGRLMLEPGSVTTFCITNGAYGLCVFGGVNFNSTKAQIYVPSPEEGAANAVATLRKTGTKDLQFGKSDEEGATGGAAITVEEGATLEIEGPVIGDQPVVKFGAGTLDFKDAITNYTGDLYVAAGSLVLRTKCAKPITVLPDATLLVGSLRELVLAGYGKVAVTLTDEEVARLAGRESVVIFTRPEGATVAIGRICNEKGEDVTRAYDVIDGGTLHWHNPVGFSFTIQ